MTAEQRAELDELIWVDPERMSGEPCFRGTRVPVQALLDHIENGVLDEEFFDGFPSVTREQAARFLKLANIYVHECASF
jgi:uncharacterized protein (DUF433 family)